MPLRHVARVQPAGMAAAGIVERDGAGVAVRVDHLDAVHGTRAQEVEQRVPGEGRAVTQHQRGAVVAARYRCGAGAQPCRREAVVLGEPAVEPPHAAEAGRIGDVADRHGGVRQQPLGEQQALRLRVLDGRDVEFGAEDAAQVAIRHAHRCRQRGQIVLLQEAFVDHARGGAGEAG